MHQDILHRWLDKRQYSIYTEKGKRANEQPLLPQSHFSAVDCFYRAFFAEPWLYFRKPLSETESVKDSEIFSDNESRIDVIDHVIKTRLLPVLIIFLCCVLPNLLKSTEDNEPFSAVFTVFFAVMTAIYSYVLIYCGLKLRKLRKKYTND